MKYEIEKIVNTPSHSLFKYGISFCMFRSLGTAVAAGGGASALFAAGGGGVSLLLGAVAGAPWLLFELEAEMICMLQTLCMLPITPQNPQNLPRTIRYDTFTTCERN